MKRAVFKLKFLYDFMYRQKYPVTEEWYPKVYELLLERFPVLSDYYPELSPDYIPNTPTPADEPKDEASVLPESSTKSKKRNRRKKEKQTQAAAQTKDTNNQGNKRDGSADVFQAAEWLMALGAGGSETTLDMNMDVD
jgi:hypothetical protein